MTDKSPNPPDLKLTKDGSHTLYSHRFGQYYHNPNGAVAESLHNFFKTNGLLQALKSREKITILEVGFGTGLNLMLLLDHYLSSKSEAEVQFYSVEAYPVSTEQVSDFNYGDHLQHPEMKQKIVDVFSSLKSGMNDFKLLPDISGHIFCGFFEDFNPKNLQADFIFHDAFSPKVNGDLWTGEVFKKLKSLSDEEAVLTTYSAASRAKGAMAWAGWKVAKARGALGKREMTIASSGENPLSNFERIDEEHFARRYENNDF